jgi:structural maintenance of chromosome 4
MYTLQNNIELTTKAIDSLTAELSEEQERNAHHLAQIEDLQKDHDEKLATFEEVKRLTDALVKDTKRIEKEEVALQRRRSTCLPSRRSSRSRSRM